MMKQIWKLALLVALLTAVTSAWAQDPLPDGDADGIPDAYDSCPTETGLNTNEGCPEGVVPDFDQDGVANSQDYCFQDAGVAEYRGCPADAYPDYDTDTVADWDDSCYDQAGTVENNGCPAEVVADFDRDGLPDAQDQCPRDFGDAANNGCIPDIDADRVPDEVDFCPDVAGLPERVGCPADFALPDGDADGIEDPFDACPEAAGAQDLGGCPDGDADLIPDSYDKCPTEAGETDLSGCTRIDTVSLPAARQPLTAANMATLTELGALRVGAWSLYLGADNQLIVQNSLGYSIYNLANADLTPLPFLPLESSQIAVSSKANVLAHVSYDPSTGFPKITLYDLTTQAQLSQLALEGFTFTNMALSPDGTLLATVHVGDPNNPTQADNSIRFWNTADGQLVNSYPYEVGLVAATFSPDGSLVVVQSIQSEAIVWRVADGTEVAKIEGNWSPFAGGSGLRFSPDGRFLVSTTPENTIQILNTADFTVASTIALPASDATLPFGVTSVDFNADASLLVVAEGLVFYEGPTPLVENLGNLHVIDVASGSVLNTFPLGSDPVAMAMFSQDGTLLITSESVNVKFRGVAQ